MTVTRASVLKAVARGRIEANAEVHVVEASPDGSVVVAANDESRFYITLGRAVGTVADGEMVDVALLGDAFRPNSEAEQIGRLAKFIQDEVPGEPSRSEGAIDCAIRLLRERLTEAPDPQPRYPGIGRFNLVSDPASVPPGWVLLEVLSRELPQFEQLMTGTDQYGTALYSQRFAANQVEPLFLFGWPLKSQVVELAAELEAARVEARAMRAIEEQRKADEKSLEHYTGLVKRLETEKKELREWLERGEAALAKLQQEANQVRAEIGEQRWRELAAPEEEA